ncbi:hypothetical protein ACU8DI_15040 [Psychroserpens sp. BH13MA-6]
MKKLISLLIIVLISCDFVLAQNKMTKIKLSDFEFTSPYYKRDIFKKKEIYEYLLKQDRKNRKIREKLSNFCSESKRKKNEDFTEKRLKTKNDSIISVLNSLGGLIFCVTEINNVGDIYYSVTHASNMNIIIDNGVLRRN